MRFSSQISIRFDPPPSGLGIAEFLGRLTRILESGLAERGITVELVDCSNDSRCRLQTSLNGATLRIVLRQRRAGRCRVTIRRSDSFRLIPRVFRGDRSAHAAPIVAVAAAVCQIMKAADVTHIRVSGRLMPALVARSKSTGFQLSLVKRPPKNVFVLPRSIIQRIGLALTCCLIMPVCAGGCYGVILAAAALGPPGRVGWLTFWLPMAGLLLLFESMLSGMLIFSVAALIWSIATPTWAERVLQFGFRRAHRAATVLLVLAITFVSVVVIAMIINLWL